jgi:deoxyadenosine/deoxycytidine kinase
MNRKFIGVAGNIGSGKSTLTEMVANHFGGEPHYESVIDNPYLEDFYEDMPRWSFPLQIYFLTHRFQSHATIQKKSGFNIQDRTIYEDANIFAPVLYKNGNMSERDYRNYLNVYNSMIEMLDKPDLIVYLKTSVQQVQDRIKLRNRDYEQGIAVDYLKALNHQYETWIESYPGNVLVIENDGLDFKNRPDDFKMIISRIESRLNLV